MYMSKGGAPLSHEVIVVGVEHALPGSEASGPLASVILPTKNGAAELRELLPRIMRQRWGGRLEIVAIDSGSEDGTVAVLREHGATVLAIAPEVFDYGLARNLAAGYARGEWLVLVTTRALPVDDQWLANLLAPMEADPRVAAVYSRTLPRLDADLLTARDEVRWSSSRMVQRVREIPDLRAYRALTSSDQLRMISCTNQSVGVRAAVLADIPFRRVTTVGEDILWAKEVLEAGYRTVFEPGSMVFHSHNYSYVELFRRFFDIGAADEEITASRMDAGALLPAIQASIRDDWNYLQDGCRLIGEELQRWRIAAVLVRMARLAGNWAGGNRDRLRGAPRSWPLLKGDPTDPYLASLQEGFAAGTGKHELAGVPLSRRGLEMRLEQAVLAEWASLEKSGLTAGELSEAQLLAAMRTVTRLVGEWLGANQADLPEDPLAWLSLTWVVKAGAHTREMDEGRSERSTVATGVAWPSARHDPGWRGDIAGLRAAVEAHERACAAAWLELDRCAEVMQRQQAEVAERDRIIRGLQAELHSKVEEANEIIRGLQSELHAKVDEANRDIARLQAALEQRGVATDHPAHGTAGGALGA